MIDDCFETESAHNQDMNKNKKEGRKIGYVRVSDKDQIEALQLDALNNAGCDLIFTDHGVSGKKHSRPAFDKMMKELRSGDTLIVWKLDRLGRSSIHLLKILDELIKLGVAFCDLTQ